MPSRLIAPLLCVAALAGCASAPPPHYYTLVPPAMPHAPAPAAPAFAFELMPVTVPLQADQPQLMLRAAGDALAPMYSERWAAPLADEVQAALSRSLTQALGAPDVSAIGAGAGLPTWRVQFDVQRFDMVLGGDAVLESTWRVRAPRPADAALLCRSEARVLADAADVTAIVQAQQRAVAHTAGVIAQAIRNEAREAGDTTGDVRLLGCTRTGAGPG